MRNEELRNYARMKKVKLWRIAEMLGIADSSFSRMLRYPITKEKIDEIKEIIDYLETETC